MTQTIIVADDHPLFRAALKQAVNQAVPDAETVEVDSIKALQAAVESHPDADLILLDLNMPGAHGFSGLVFMRGQYPGLPVVVVSGSEDLQVMRRSNMPRKRRGALQRNSLVSGDSATPGARPGPGRELRRSRDGM